MTEQKELDHELQELFANAKKAAAAFCTFKLDKVNEILQHVGMKCAEKAEFYAEWAVRDTGYGSLQDKILKKQIGSAGQLQAYNAADYIEPRIDREKKIISYPRPAGVVVGLMPCTNPVSTVFGLSMMALFSRNAIILCPHPASVNCCVHATDLVAQLAEEAGAPKHTVQILRHPTLETVNAIMASPDNNLTMAIGGPGMVRAAYSSGRPAMGVGAGNVPCYVHKTADPAVVGPTVIMSSSFDNSLPCTTESVILTDSEIAEAMRASMTAAGGYFVEGEELQRLRDFCYPEGVTNMDILGKDAIWLAEKAGFLVPEETRSLVVEIDRIGHDEPISKEKLWPILGFKVIKGGVEEARNDALAMLEMMGKGHSAAVHASDSEVIAQYTAVMPVCRISVNAANLLGAQGTDTNLPPTLMLGTGFYSGSSTDENVTPGHMIQWTRVAYNKDPAFAMKDDIDAAVAAAYNAL